MSLGGNPPPRKSLIFGKVGVILIGAIQVFWAYLVITPSLDIAGEFWSSWAAPFILMGVIAMLVGVACYLDYQRTTPTDRTIGVFKPFGWCVLLVVVAAPIVFYIAALIGFDIAF